MNLQNIKNDLIHPKRRLSKERGYSQWACVGIAVLAAAQLWFCMDALGLIRLIPFLNSRPESMLYFLLAGVLLGLIRLFLVPVFAAGVVLILWLVVCLTPLASSLALSLRTITPSSSLRPQVADAVVVLGAGIQMDDQFNTVSEARFLKGLQVVRQDWAPLMVLTQSPSPSGSHLKAAQNMVDSLKISCQMTVVGPVHNTHDEAVAVTKLAHRRKWKTIILVTSPTHSRRAEMVFRHAGNDIGLKVLSVPCQETIYDLDNVITPAERVEAFSESLHEIIGIVVYRMRGWV